MYKQLIIARRDLNMSPGKLAAQVSHASMAFLTTAIQEKTVKFCTNRHEAIDYETGEPILYRRGDLYQWAKEACARGEKYFYCEPVDENNQYGEFRLCEPKFEYMTSLRIDPELYEGWIKGSFTKVVCGARNMGKLQKAIDKAISLGMKEGVDFFVIRDACRTELEPENPDGSTITCVGFKPMPAEIIDQIGKEYNLF